MHIKAWIRKCGIITVGIILLTSMTRCSGRNGANMRTAGREGVNMQASDGKAADTQFTDNQSAMLETKVEDIPPNEQTDEEKLAEIYLAYCRNDADQNKTDDLEAVQRVVNGFGAEGYSAVDSKNQVDMTETEQVMHFCESVEEKKEAGLTIVEVNYPEGFYVYDLRTEEGEVNVTKRGYEYEGKNIKKTIESSYLAEHWQYTEDGYLIFSGNWYSEEMYVLVMSEAEEHTALRVQPLDQVCRELNRKYILPAGYKENNIFLTDWNEEDFGELDFYDAFDRCYVLTCGQSAPYAAKEGEGTGGEAAYRIPENIFERVIMKYFEIDQETLRSKTVYCPEDMAYAYRPRGFYERDYPEMPYPEVESYTENGDGTITLIVSAVYPKENTSRAFRHRTVVRPLDDGSFRYVSNEVILEGEEYDLWWHTERLSEAEQETVYEAPARR